MKVKGLLDQIHKLLEDHPDLLEWDVYTEQLTEYDKDYKRKPVRNDIKWYHEDNGQGWEFIKDCEESEYFKCYEAYTLFTKEKIFTINVNY